MDFNKHKLPLIIFGVLLALGVICTIFPILFVVLIVMALAGLLYISLYSILNDTDDDGIF